MHDFVSLILVLFWGTFYLYPLFILTDILCVSDFVLIFINYNLEEANAVLDLVQ